MAGAHGRPDIPLDVPPSLKQYSWPANGMWPSTEVIFQTKWTAPFGVLMGTGWKVWALPVSALFLECLCVAETPAQIPLLHLLPWAEEQSIIKADHFLLNGKQARKTVTSVST